MTAAPELLFERRGAVGLITLNRPDRLNALNAALLDALHAALDACADESCRAVLITGAGRGFCAGQDLAERGPEKPISDVGLTLEKTYNPLVLKLRGLPKPVIVAVNGVAAGAGANIALAGDIVLAARSASFIQVFSRIALVPDAGGTFWLTQRLGEVRAKALAMTADPLAAQTAADWGLIWKVCDDEKLIPEALALAERLAEGPTAAYALTKQAIHAASGNTLEKQLALERTLQREAGLSPDFREGVAAFLAKRPAKFTGRRR
ncbi:MAG: 2-(1,2-epoxy-1,2-dihydrophenyl)acetyl-CoA isomerase PaaG [Rhizobiaceae bacterium]